MKPSPQPDFETHGNEFLDNSHLGFLLLGEEAEIRVVRERSPARAARSTTRRGCTRGVCWVSTSLGLLLPGKGCQQLWLPQQFLAALQKWEGAATPLPQLSNSKLPSRKHFPYLTPARKDLGRVTSFRFLIDLLTQGLVTLS